jgi:hypothetical protein
MPSKNAMTKKKSSNKGKHDKTKVESEPKNVTESESEDITQTETETDFETGNETESDVEDIKIPSNPRHSKKSKKDKTKEPPIEEEPDTNDDANKYHHPLMVQIEGCSENIDKLCDTQVSKPVKDDKTKNVCAQITSLFNEARDKSIKIIKESQKEQEANNTSFTQHRKYVKKIVANARIIDKAFAKQNEAIILRKQNRKRVKQSPKVIVTDVCVDFVKKNQHIHDDIVVEENDKGKTMISHQDLLKLVSKYISDNKCSESGNMIKFNSTLKKFFPKFAKEGKMARTEIMGELSTHFKGEQ